ncbi:hypothetical protein [Streptomyces sp. NPDC088789]|uniref:hypothetical protein n=1 Tax=Streptomyces sp. NPDC088789 TaxID=3365899 RepID=UPI0037F7D26C
MSGAPAHAERAGRRVEEALDRLSATGDADAVAAGEELVRSLMEFYGAGLARIRDLLSPPGNRNPLDLLNDELVASLLLLHDLHPEDVTARVHRALEHIGDGVEIVGLDAATGTLRLRAVAAGGCGCAVGTSDVRSRAEEALAHFAPEVTTVELDTEPAPREPALLQIGIRPGAGA